MIITRFTDYTLQTPQWFIRYLKDEFVMRDVPGHFGDNLKTPNISATHPLVRITGMILAGGKADEASSILPAISVTIDPENEEIITKGYGLKTPFVIDQAWIDEVRNTMPLVQRNQDEGKDIPMRQRNGMITDNQLELIENTVRKKGPILAEKNQISVRETIYVSLWAHTIDERDALWYLLRSILTTMKEDASRAGLRDFGPMSTPRGLVNMNFGRMLHGQETRMDYLNDYNTYTVTDRIETENGIDLSAEWLFKSNREGDEGVEC